MCSHCGKQGNLSLFAKTGSKGAVRCICKDCRNLYARNMARMNRGSAQVRASKLVSAAKSRATERNLSFDLDVEWVLERLEIGLCQLSGEKFDLTETRGFATPSLDRINPKGGYTKQNTRVILFGLNAALGTWGTKPLFEAVLKSIQMQSSASTIFSRRLAANLKKKTGSHGSILYNLTWDEMVTPSGRVLPRLRASAWRGAKAPTRDGFSGPYAIAEIPWLPDAWAILPIGLIETLASAAPISASGSILSGWPTPCSQDGPKGGPSQGNDRLPGCAQLAGWVSPMAQDGSRGSLPPRPHDTGVPLSQQVAMTLPARLTADGCMRIGLPAAMAWLAAG